MTTGLRHGLWTPLSETLELVKSWPGMLDRFGENGFRLAEEEFNDSARRTRFAEWSPANRLLQTVVVPYLGSVPETILCARAQMMDVFRANYSEWKEAYEQNVDNNRIQLLPEVIDRTECIRIEVIDLGANFNSRDGFVPQGVRGKDSAHAGVIYAAPQNTAWVRAMDGSNVPYALAGGYKLNVPGRGEWSRLPDVWRNGDRAELNGYWCGLRYHEHALPTLWE